MTKGRLEAFSDGVLAIIITIMVLEMKVPHGTEPEALRPLIPVFLSYVMSFVYLGIYWNNHHHMLQASKKVNGAILWANLHLLFWLSLIPFVTGWMGENNFAHWPVFLYGCVLLGAALAYFILSRLLVRHHGEGSPLSQAFGRDVKAQVSILLYVIGTAVAVLNSYIAVGFFVLVALMWLIPDRRIERTVASAHATKD